jgi:hypothetical protein
VLAALWGFQRRGGGRGVLQRGRESGSVFVNSRTFPGKV